MEPEIHHEADELLLGFSRSLRSAGIGITSDRAQMFLRATALLGAEESRAAYWAGRATLCAGVDDVDAYDRVFDAWFSGDERPSTGQEPPDLFLPLPASAEDFGRDEDGDADDDEQQRALVSDTEVLRHRDIGSMDPAEKRDWPCCSVRCGRGHPDVPPTGWPGTAVTSMRGGRCGRCVPGWVSPSR